MKPKTIIIIAVALIIVVFSVIIGTQNKPLVSPDAEIKPLEQNKLAEIAKDIRGVSGKIITVGKDYIAVEALIMMKDPSKTPIKNNVKVTADANTIITRLIFPSPEKMMDSTGSITPKQEILKLNELNIGDTVDVRSSNNIYESIKSGVSFVASTINAIAYE